MPSTYSPDLRIELQAPGENVDTWGDITNVNLGTLLEQAIAGVEAVAMTDANYTLTTANGASDEARNAVVIMTGTLTATRNVICPTSDKVYLVKNSTTGGQSIVFKTSAGTGVTITNGTTALVYCDATNVVAATGDMAYQSASSVAITGGSISGATINVPNTGFSILDTNASHSLSIVAGSNLTANRTLTILTGDASRTLAINASSTVSGTNTGDQTITLTGDVTGSGTGSFAATIAASAVTNAKLANMAQNTIKGRTTAGPGDPEDLTAAQAAAILSTAGVAREVLTANRTYYVRTDGSDSNNGLADNAGGAFLTIAKALATAAALDCSTFDLTIQVRSGTRTTPVVLPTMIGSGTFTLRGDPTTPANVVISTTSHNGIYFKGFSRWVVDGIKIQTTTSGHGLICEGGLLDYSNMAFGACAQFQVIALGPGSKMKALTGYRIAGGGVAHLGAVNGGYVVAEGVVITFAASVAYSVSFAYADTVALLEAGTLTFTLGGNTVTGPRYTASILGVINVRGGGASYFPGNSAGSGSNPSASPYGVYL